jgi:hypothetical protein
MHYREAVHEHCDSGLCVDGLFVGEVGDYCSHRAAEDLRGVGYDVRGVWYDVCGVKCEVCGVIYTYTHIQTYIPV